MADDYDSIDPDLLEHVKGLVASGKYDTVKEYLNDLVKRDMQTQRDIRQKIADGLAQLDSGDVVDGGEVFQEINDRLLDLKKGEAA